MGQTVGGMFNPDVVNPSQARWGDLDSGEKGSRVLGGAISGLGKGLQNYSQQNAMMRQGGPQAPIYSSPQPQVSASYFAPQKRPMADSFYGG